MDTTAIIFRTISENVVHKILKHHLIRATNGNLLFHSISAEKQKEENYESYRH